jgi:RNA polymerase sigma-70 factor (ECF subfamily)
LKPNDSSLPGSRISEERLFDTLFEGHRRAVFAFLYGQTGRRDSASDLLQEVFVRVWTHVADARPLYEEQRLFWILRIARSVLTDSRRRLAVRAHLTCHLAPAAESGTTSHEQSVLNRATLEQIDAAIGDLPEELRTVLTMTVLGGLTSGEIGKLLDRPSGTIRFQLSEARRRIARQVAL